MENNTKMGPFIKAGKQFFFDAKPMAECEEKSGMISNPVTVSDLLKANGIDSADGKYSSGYVVWDCARNKAVVYMDESIRNPDTFGRLQKAFGIKDYELAQTEKDRIRKTEEERAARHDFMCERLESIIEKYNEEQSFDAKECMKVCFDAYHFYRAGISENPEGRSIRIREIKLIGLLGAISCMDEDFRLDDYGDLECLACIDLAENLLDEISIGFEDYYIKNHMVITRFVHVPAGCSELTVNMNDFDKMYDGLMDYINWKYGVDEDEEEYDEEE